MSALIVLNGSINVEGRFKSSIREKQPNAIMLNGGINIERRFKSSIGEKQPKRLYLGRFIPMIHGETVCSLTTPKIISGNAIRGFP